MCFGHYTQFGAREVDEIMELRDLLSSLTTRELISELSDRGERGGQFLPQECKYCGRVFTDVGSTLQSSTHIDSDLFFCNASGRFTRRPWLATKDEYQPAYNWSIYPLFPTTVVHISPLSTYFSSVPSDNTVLRFWSQYSRLVNGKHEPTTGVTDNKAFLLDLLKVSGGITSNFAMNLHTEWSQTTYSVYTPRYLYVSSAELGICEIGAHVSNDETGTGKSSLNYLFEIVTRHRERKVTEGSSIVQASRAWFWQHIRVDRTQTIRYFLCSARPAARAAPLGSTSRNTHQQIVDDPQQLALTKGSGSSPVGMWGSRTWKASIGDPPG
ncbi:hypothetical protein DFP72DRAFT_848557 [Ephemerocybe angulata]|uniref:Uncharacterized protein n=1 Tax=Ephemerocybe angulata TaxID=980116 RepID=A0A8H6M462_9AGAR|nr:hypothetical protein DFP72DRAFT_848557 [Tulosesus angulatus]